MKIFILLVFRDRFRVDKFVGLKAFHLEKDAMFELRNQESSGYYCKIMKGVVE